MLFHGSSQSTPYPSISSRPREREKPRLPKLVPHVNKRAQHIVAQHYRSLSHDDASSTATVPVLMQIDSTAPRTARTHDISHLRDVAGFLKPCIPPSQIDEAFHQYEKSFLPQGPGSRYSEEDGLWYTKLFPSDTPSSREDAVLLDSWITRCMEQYTQAGAGRQDLVHAVEDLAPVLSIALHELVRQVMHHCPERGVVLKKIWETYVQLFSRVLKQMQVSLHDQRQRAGDVSQVLGGVRDDLDLVRRSHPEQMQKVISDLEAKFTQRQTEVERELKEHKEQNQRLKADLRRHHGELELWYPSFQLYQDSYIKSHIPQYVANRGPTSRRGRSRKLAVASSRKQTDASDDIDGGQVAEEEEEELPPEVAIAEDFKRLFAVISPEKRRLIGKELTEVLGPALLSSTTVATNKGRRNSSSKAKEDKPVKDEEAAAIAVLKSEVSTQEDQIRNLRDTIAQLERVKERAAAEKNRGQAKT